MTESEKKKEPTFRKVENGLIFTSEYGISVGFPTEVEEMTQAEGGVLFPIGGKAKGAKYTKVKYNWQVISGSALPSDEMGKLKGLIAATSGTIVASLTNAVPVPASGAAKLTVTGEARVVDITVLCKNCGASNLKSGKFCSNCGNPLH